MKPREYDIELWCVDAQQTVTTTIRAYTLGDAVGEARRKFPAPMWEILDAQEYVPPFENDNFAVLEGDFDQWGW